MLQFTQVSINTSPCQLALIRLGSSFLLSPNQVESSGIVPMHKNDLTSFHMAHADYIDLCVRYRAGAV